MLSAEADKAPPILFGVPANLTIGTSQLKSDVTVLETVPEVNAADNDFCFTPTVSGPRVRTASLSEALAACLRLMSRLDALKLQACIVSAAALSL
jgi:hypothetical protein